MANQFNILDTPVGSALWIPADTFTLVSGSPSFSHVNRSPAWLLDAAAAEGVGRMVDIPQGWATYDVDLWWTNAGAGSGNVVHRLDRQSGIESGTTLANPSAGSLVTTAAPAQSVVAVTTIASGISAPTFGQMVTLVLFRIGSDAGDTLANDSGALGLRLRRVT